ncbi:MAG: recombinase RecT [Jatrophihabitans sp.]|uniref:recombinase RecT n=1 Tax=Jatrophihabitans sp. TaxID=1932789 RepID=UPI003F7EC8F9
MTSIRDAAQARGTTTSSNGGGAQQPPSAAGGQQPGTDVAKRDNSARGLIEQYSSDFATVLPSHIKPATWVRVAQGALKKGKKVRVKAPSGEWVERFELEVAAQNNPAAFLSALLDAARQGLEPGTDQYYLTPRKVKGELEILGVRGYQGEIEMMYRAGAVASVIVEVVRERDTFVWTPGRVDPQRRWEGPQERPFHEVDWFADDRGGLRGVYAYAVMKSGSTSKVVVLNRKQVEAARDVSPGSQSEYSPWVKWEEAMWLKTAAHHLHKWVPTSAEYLETMARAAGTAAGAAQAERARALGVASPPLRSEVELGANPNYNGDQVFDAEIVDEADVPPPGVDPQSGEMVDPREPDDQFFADLEAGR